VEFDLQPSADGAPVLFHDDTLDRTAGVGGAIRETALADLQVLDAGQWFSEAHVGEGIPTLGQALDLIVEATDWEGTVFPELKGPVPLPLAERVAEAVLTRGMAARTVLISLDWEPLVWIRSAFPEIRVGFVVSRSQDVLEALDLCAAREGDVLDPDRRILLERPQVSVRAHEAGIPLACWTVDDPAEATLLVRMGVSDLTTNRVSLLLDWRRDQEASGQGEG
jgi:glycerophosphoryl diester phosphodiesterase